MTASSRAVCPIPAELARQVLATSTATATPTSCGRTTTARRRSGRWTARAAVIGPRRHNPSRLARRGHRRLQRRRQVRPPVADDNGTVGIWLMNGVTSSRRRGRPNGGPTGTIEGTGDFNGDGKADILWQHDNGTIGIWLMDGSTCSRRQWSAVQSRPDWHIERHRRLQRRRQGRHPVAQRQRHVSASG